MTDTVATTAPASELALQPGQTGFTAKQSAALALAGVKQASPADLAVFFHQCARTGLDPFAKQIYMISRGGKQTIQTAIDGFRVIARRAADKAGETIGYDDTLWCGEDGKWTDVWLKKTAPAAAKVTIYRGTQRFSAVALWSEYGSNQNMWKTMPTHMLAKVAEALVLRKAFPQDLSGVYTDDEMAQADGRAPAFQERPAAAPKAAPAADAPKRIDGATQQEIAAYMDELGLNTPEQKKAKVHAWSTENVDYPVNFMRDLKQEDGIRFRDDIRDEFSRAADDAPAALSDDVVEGELVDSE